MANVLYNTFKQGLLYQEFFLTAQDIRATLFDTAAYSFNLSHSLYYGDIPEIGKVAQQALASKTVVNGVFDSANFTWSSVSGAESEAILLWSASHANGRLLAYYDVGMTGIPIQPNGSDINVTVNGGGWFAL